MDERPHKLWLNQLICPIESGFHSDYEAVASETRAWAERLGIVPDAIARRCLERSDVARLAAAVYYDSYSRRALQLATDFIAWLCLHDDLWVDGVRRDPRELDRDHDRLLAILAGAPPAADDPPLARAFGDLRA